MFNIIKGKKSNLHWESISPQSKCLSSWKQTTNAGEDTRKEDLYILSLEMKISPVSVEISMEVLYNIEIEPPYDPAA
jgi:hypothetical protein